MERHDKRPKRSSTPAAVAAAFATPATLLLAVCAAFCIVSSEPMLSGSPHAPSAAVGCDALDERDTRQHCERRLVPEPEAHDSGAAQLAVLAARPRGAGQ